MGGTRVGVIIRQARKRAGLTLEEVAEQVQVTPGALSHIESGRRLPNPSNAVRIAQALQINPGDLMDALDREHSLRRERAAYETLGPAAASKPAVGDVYQAQSIEALFSQRMSPSSSSMSCDSVLDFVPEPSMRDTARWSDDTTQRLRALDQLADTAADAVRTLRGLLEDENPTIRREARRLLRELDVRLPEE